MRYSPFEASLLRAIASQVAAAIVNARLRRDAVEAERMERLTYVDHACLDMLMTWEKQHEATGGRLVID